MIIVKEFTFHAAHFLPGHPTCGRMHGHTYKVHIGLAGLVNIDTGMIVDFARIKELCFGWIEQVDHNTLNTVLGENTPPTAENLTMFIAEQVDELIIDTEIIELAFVKVWETPTAFVLWVNPMFALLTREII